jgi:hypothetical protein
MIFVSWLFPRFSSVFHPDLKCSSSFLSEVLFQFSAVSRFRFFSNGPPPSPGIFTSRESSLLQSIFLAGAKVQFFRSQRCSPRFFLLPICSRCSSQRQPSWYAQERPPVSVPRGEGFVSRASLGVVRLSPAQSPGAGLRLMIDPRSRSDASRPDFRFSIFSSPRHSVPAARGRSFRRSSCVSRGPACLGIHFDSPVAQSWSARLFFSQRFAARGQASFPLKILPQPLSFRIC